MAQSEVLKCAAIKNIAGAFSNGDSGCLHVCAAQTDKRHSKISQLAVARYFLNCALAC